MSVLTISSFIPQVSWPHGGSTATLRIKYSGDFVDSAGQQVLRGLHKDVACTIAAGVLTVPQFTLITTNDAQVNPLVTCSAQFFDSNSSARDWLFQQFSIPESLTPTTNIGALAVYNLGISLVLPPDFYLNRDEVTSLALNLIAITAPALHAPTHQNGGTDEITVTGLSGLLADGQTPLAHAASHQNGGADEISVVGLSGLLADAQTPIAHAASHISGGSDPFTSAQLLEAVIKRIRTSTGPADLLVGAIADGEFLKRDGAGIISGVPAGTGAPSDATYIVQTANGGLSAEQALSALATGLVKNTTGTGALSIGAAGTDYVAPGGALGTPSSGALTNCTADGTNGVGFKNIPQNSQSVDYTAVLGDAGWHLYHPTSDDNPRTFTIPANASVAYPVGTAITFINDQNTLTIAITSDTLVWAEDGSTGSRTLAESGIATAIKVTSTRWIISGVGLS